MTAVGIPERASAPQSLDVVDELAPLRDAWDGLAAASRNIFATWEWHDAWWRHYGGDRNLQVALLARDREPEAIVPLYEWARKPLRILRLVGHGHGDRLGPVCGETDREASARAFRLALATENHDVFVGDWLAGDRAWAQILGGRTLRRTGYPLVPLEDGSWEAFLGRRSTRFRKTLRHRRNRLARRGDARFRAATAVSLERDLDASFGLHRARFGSHAGCLFCGRHEPFQRDFAARALDRGWLRLLLLEVHGRPVAVDYGFVFEGAHFAYQGGWDPTWAGHSVGFLLEAESIRRALEEGAREYRFLGGDEGYKYRYSTQDPELETVVVPGSRRGRAAAAALTAAWRVPGARAVLRRLGAA